LLDGADPTGVLQVVFDKLSVLPVEGVRLPMPSGISPYHVLYAIRNVDTELVSNSDIGRIYRASGALDIPFENHQKNPDKVTKNTYKIISDICCDCEHHIYNS